MNWQTCCHRDIIRGHTTSLGVKSTMVCESNEYERNNRGTTGDGDLYQVGQEVIEIRYEETPSENFAVE
jgi:hypothetical protein